MYRITSTVGRSMLRKSIISRWLPPSKGCARWLGTQQLDFSQTGCQTVDSHKPMNPQSKELRPPSADTDEVNPQDQMQRTIAQLQAKVNELEISVKQNTFINGLISPALLEDQLTKIQCDMIIFHAILTKIYCSIVIQDDQALFSKNVSVCNNSMFCAQYCDDT